MTFANFPELGRALTQQCSRAVLPEQEFAFLQRIVLVETRTLDLLDLVVPSTNSATQPQLLVFWEFIICFFGCRIESVQKKNENNCSKG